MPAHRQSKRKGEAELSTASCKRTRQTKVARSSVGIAIGTSPREQKGCPALMEGNDNTAPRSKRGRPVSQTYFIAKTVHQPDPQAKPRGRPRKQPALQPSTAAGAEMTSAEEQQKVRPRGRPRKQPVSQHPPADGAETIPAAEQKQTRPRGRPRKHPSSQPSPAAGAKTMPAEDQQKARPRGRPRKQPVSQPQPAAEKEAQARPRGRPRKHPTSQPSPAAEAETMPAEEQNATTQREIRAARRSECGCQMSAGKVTRGRNIIGEQPGSTPGGEGALLIPEPNPSSTEEAEEASEVQGTGSDTPSKQQTPDQLTKRRSAKIRKSGLGSRRSAGVTEGKHLADWNGRQLHAEQSRENVDPLGRTSPARQPMAGLRPRSPLTLAQEEAPGCGLPDKLTLPSGLRAAARDAQTCDATLCAKPPIAAAALPAGCRTDPQDAAWFDPADPAKVNTVAAALHVAHPPTGSLPVCRDAEATELTRLLQLHISCSQGGSIYVSGLPGTGKSLTVHEVARQCWASAAETRQAAPALKIVSLNCMSLQQPAAVLTRSLEALQSGRPTVRGDPIIYAGVAGQANREDALEALKEYVQQQPATPSKKSKDSGMLVLILDEMDQLVSHDQSLLYALFSLPQLARSRLILIGISNSIDMAERTLPRLKEVGSHPHAVPFPSYSTHQVGEIICQRLSTLPGPAFQQHAITFCARKMAAQSGDMRRALEACVCALKNLVADVTSAGPAPSEDEGHTSKNLQQPAVPKRLLVGIGDMAKAISSLQGGAGEASAAVQAMRSLPQQQQLVLCAATKLLGQADPAEAADSAPGAPSPAKGHGTPQSVSKKLRVKSFMSPAPSRSRLQGTPTKAPGSAKAGMLRPSLHGSAHEWPLGILHESYARLCRQVAMKPLNSNEFAAACSTLADLGIMVLGKAKEERLRRVSLRAHNDDIALALQDVRLLRNVLSLAL